jgi:hypothetical protein
VPAEHRLASSTGGTALDYSAPMRSKTIIVPVLLLLLADNIGCREETPANTPGEFGDPCIPGANDDTPDGCVAGAECYVGYCEEKCVEDTDCQMVTDWDHVCVAGLCHLLCDDNKGCPETLDASLTCGVIGTSRWCEARDEES